MELKRAEVIMLPTHKGMIPSILKNGNKLTFTSEYKFLKNYNSEQYKSIGFEIFDLYFTTDDEIKEGDWCYHNVFGIGNIQLINKKECFVTKKRHDNDGSITTPWERNIPKIKKIIATTDKSLKIGLCGNCNQGKCYDKYLECKSLLPKPSQAFIEKYCKVGGIDEVLVEYEPTYLSILKEKILGYKLKVDSHNTITIHPIKNTWTREENVKLFSKVLHDASKAGYFKMDSFREKSEFEHNWIKENL